MVTAQTSWENRLAINCQPHIHCTMKNICGKNPPEKRPLVKLHLEKSPQKNISPEKITPETSPFRKIVYCLRFLFGI